MHSLKKWHESFFAFKKIHTLTARWKEVGKKLFLNIAKDNKIKWSEDEKQFNGINVFI